MKRFRSVLTPAGANPNPNQPALIAGAYKGQSLPEQNDKLQELLY